MPAKKKELQNSNIDEATAYLIEMGVSEEKAKARAKSLPSMNLNGESPFTFAGSQYRPDLFRYSVVSNDKQQRDLERKGFTKLPESADVYQIGVSGGRIMVRDIDIDRKAKAERARRDYDRRNAKNRKSGGVLDQETGARFDITSNASPATAIEGAY
tara:strand:- start:33 stop:503 length:471 start_codon:yes stop_codon:yes gene_type:complete